MNRLTSYLVAALLLLPLFLTDCEGASVKPLEVFSEKILQREVEHFADSHIYSSVMLRRAIDRMNREMNIMSRGNILESQKLLRNASEALAVSVKSAVALSNYLAVNSARLKSSGHGRFLPLAGLNSEIEEPYLTAMGKFLTTAEVFVNYCGDNFEALSNGSKDKEKRYDELYAEYVKVMDKFNDQSIKRSELLADWGSEYPELWELMPR